MGIRTGEAYLKALDHSTREIWVDGEKISTNFSQHCAFKAAAQCIADLYDMQHCPELIDEITYISPLSGKRVGISFLPPKTMEDLIKRRAMMTRWASYSNGMLGRTPDCLNTQMMAMASAADFLGKHNPLYADRLRKYYEYIRENDLFLCYTMTQPRANKALGWDKQTNPFLAARLLEKNEQGIVIKGARMIVSSPIADEILVLPHPHTRLTSEEAPYTFAFAIPTSTPGIKFICRNCFSDHSHFDHPLASRFEEQDALVIFDNVLVPWDRVFLLEDIEISNKFLKETGSFNHITYQEINRTVVKTDFLLGIVSSIVNIMGMDQFQHVQEKVAEVVIILETMKAFMRASEADATLNQWGIMTPHLLPLEIARNSYSQLYPRIREIIYLMSGSALISLPTEKNTYASDIRKDIDIYYQAKNTNADDRIMLFHLAWDIAGSDFGSRQELYERFFFGDPVRMASQLYQSYDKKTAENKVWSFLHREVRENA
jgi:4-hydroxyphenylacetate 3-monooxygenase